MTGWVGCRTGEDAGVDGPLNDARRLLMKEIRLDNENAVANFSEPTLDASACLERPRYNGRLGPS